MIATLGDFGVESWRAQGRIGIWTRDIDGREAKGSLRRDRCAHPPLGYDARFLGEPGAQPVAFRRDRALRDRGIRRHQPRPAGAGVIRRRGIGHCFPGGEILAMLDKPCPPETDR